MNFLKRLFAKKKTVVQINNSDRVTFARNKIEKSLDLFRQVHNDLEEANKELDSVIQEERDKVAESHKIIENAQTERQSNGGLQEQVKPFLKD